MELYDEAGNHKRFTDPRQPVMKKWPSYTHPQLIDALLLVADVLSWQSATIDDFHRYAHRFGGQPGGDVYEFALLDALRMRGLTLDQLRERD